MNQHHVGLGRCMARVVVMAVSLLMLTAVASHAQQMVRFVGSVQWIAGSRMQVMTPTGTSVVVDLTEADYELVHLHRRLLVHGGQGLGGGRHERQSASPHQPLGR